MRVKKCPGGSNPALLILREGMGVPQEDIARIEEQVKTLFNDVAELKEDVKCIKDQLANRLPLWATMLIGALTGVCGWLAK
jgi:cytochrome b